MWPFKKKSTMMNPLVFDITPADFTGQPGFMRSILDRALRRRFPNGRVYSSKESLNTHRVTSKYTSEVTGNTYRITTDLPQVTVYGFDDKDVMHSYKVTPELQEFMDVAVLCPEELNLPITFSLELVNG